jgi:hypothetical protein
MGRILHQLKTLPGALLSLCILLVILFWVLNFAAKRAPAPVAGFAANVEQHANGSAYTG